MADPVAITGMGCRFPGGLATPAQLWQALAEGRHLVTQIPPDRWERMRPHLHPDQTPSTPFAAGVLDDITSFDAAFFGISPREAEAMDPQQRLLLEVTVEALADAGLTREEVAGHQRMGVYVGAACLDQASINADWSAPATLHTVAGAAMALLSNRVSYHLDLRGPSLTVDTACSSALVALDHARVDLLAGRTDLAVVAGVNILLDPRYFAAFANGGVLSETGVCRPFDADGDGYVRSEGAGAVILRRADHARQARDRIYAEIVGGATAQAGYVPDGIMAPDRDAQEQVLRAAYADAELDPTTVDYVQAHGTGTLRGDLVEATALSEVLCSGRDTALPIGSVKGALGHLEAASGIVSVMTTALALRQASIPPTVHLRQPRHQLERARVTVPATATSWPHSGNHRVAGVSSLGFGGTGVHLVLTTPTSPEPAPPAADTGAGATDGAVVVPVAAHSAAALRATAATWASALTPPDNGVDQVDTARLAATAWHRRDHTAPHGTTHRAAVVARDPAAAATALRALAEARPHPGVYGPRGLPARLRRREVAFVFGGHGAHWPDMGRVLYEREPVFAAEVERVRRALAAHVARPWAPGEIPASTAALQQAIFVVQMGLVALLSSWHVRPDVVVGHSLGEVAATCHAGALSLEDAALLLVHRSAVLDHHSNDGAMLATELTAAQAREVVADHPDLVVAAHNSPTATVVSGPEPALERLGAHLGETGVWSRVIADTAPAHHPMLTPEASELPRVLAPMRPRATDTRVISTATGQVIDGADLDAAYWTHQLTHPVHFTEALEHLAAQAVVVEVGPRSVLAPHITGTRSDVALAAAGRPDRHEVDEHTALLEQAADLYTHGPVPLGLARPGLPPVELGPPAWDHDGDADPDSAPLAATVRDELDRATGPEDGIAVLTRAVLTLATEALYLDDETIDPTTTSLVDVGADSLRMIDIRNRIRELHPGLAECTYTDLVEPPTMAALAEALYRRLD